MTKVVELKAGRRASDQLPDPGPWFGPLETRISRIERTLDRLEWQVWLVLCGVGAMVLIGVLDTLKLT